MKKIVICVCACLLLLTGCGSKKNENTAKKDLKQIESRLLELSNFKNHESVSKSSIEKKYSLDLGDADVMMIASKSFDDATMVLVIESNDQTKKEIDAFVNAYNDQWVKMNYFPEQKELVEDATYEKNSDYIIYIVSKNNDEVLKIVNA